VQNEGDTHISLTKAGCVKSCMTPGSRAIGMQLPPNRRPHIPNRDSSRSITSHYQAPEKPGRKRLSEDRVDLIGLVTQISPLLLKQRFSCSRLLKS
jgi:hypothetical protein